MTKPDKVIVDAPVTGATRPPTVSLRRRDGFMTKIRHLLVLGLLIVAGGAVAQSYPDKSRLIKIIVPFGAGGSGDLMARALARGVTEVSGMNVIVENKPGAEGVIGVQAVRNAAPDGYTLLLTTSSTQVLNVHMIPQLPYDPVADFVPLTGISKTSLVMNAGPKLPFKTAREFIEAARAHPGQYSFGSGSTSTRLAAESLLQLADIKLLSVPYKSVAEAMTALGSGQVDIAFSDPPTGNPHYLSGRARPLAGTGPARMAAYPNVPTLREQGVADYEVTAWFATYFPARTPPAVSAVMREILQKAVKARYVTEVLTTFALEPLELSGDELTTLQRLESEKWGKLVRSTRLGPQ